MVVGNRFHYIYRGRGRKVLSKFAGFARFSGEIFHQRHFSLRKAKQRNQQLRIRGLDNCSSFPIVYNLSQM